MRQLLTPLSTIALAAALTAASVSVSLAQNQDTPPAAGAEAVEPLSAEEALVVDGKSYAARYNVSLEEAMRRITLMAGTGDDIAALGTEFGDEVSGIYFENGADFGLKVRLTGQEKRAARRIERKEVGRAERQAARKAENQERRALRQKLRISDAEVAQAGTVLDSPASVAVEFIPGARKGRKTVRQTIRTNFAQINQLIPSLQGIGYDEKKGAVIVQVVGEQSAIPEAARTTVAGLFDIPVEYEFIARPLSPTAARGGTQLSYPDGSAMCTAAFVGSDASNRPGLFTAAHCFAIGGQNVWYTDTDGKRYQLITDSGLNLYTTKEDVMFLRFPTGLTGLAQFYANRNEAPRALTGRRTLGTTDVASGTAQGTWVCYYGLTSSPTYGQGCGEVKYKEFAASTTGSQGKMTVSNGPSYYVQVQGPTSGMRCGPGDSGAPWFVYNVAFGIMSSCGENMVGSNSAANYTSMDAAYARNYKLTY